MANNNESPIGKSSDFSPILQLRQDDVVAVPLDQYKRLISSDIRLEILRQKRLNEIRDVREGGYLSLRDDDYLLGDAVVAAVNQKLAGKEGKE